MISSNEIKLSNEEEYNIIPTVKFYVLKDEYMDNYDENNPNSTILIRDYICYDGNSEGHGISTFTNWVVIPKTDKTGNIIELKNAIAPESLKLAPNTIVSEKVKKQWQEEGHRPEYEYYDESPKGLSYNDLKPSYVQMRKTKDTVTITTDRNTYSSAMSSARGIKMSPNFSSMKKHIELEYRWTTDRGEFISDFVCLGKTVNNKGETVLWSAIEEDRVADIKSPFEIRLEVIDSKSQEILADTELTIYPNKGFYEIKK